MTSPARPLRLADAVTQPCFSRLTNRHRHVPDSSTADPHASWSLICAYSWDVIFTCHSYARYCDISLLLNKCLLMCILWNGSRDIPTVLYRRRMGPKNTCPPVETPDQLYDRYGEMARLRRPRQAGTAQTKRGLDPRGYVPWQAFSSSSVYERSILPAPIKARDVVGVDSRHCPHQRR